MRGGAVPATEAAGLPDLLRSRAHGQPDQVALVVYGGAHLTFGEWEARSNAAARGLVARGVRPGDRVALVFGGAGWAGYAVAYLAVHKAGAAAVPLGDRLAPPELAAVLAHCEPRLVVGGGAGPSSIAAEDLEAGRDTGPFQVPVDPGTLAEVVYTSGTSGTPKGVAVSHASLLAFDLPADPAGVAGASAGDGRPLTVLHAFPIGTSAAQELLRAPLRRAGMAVVALPSFDPDRLCRAVAAHGARRLQLVPTMAQVLVASGAAGRHDVASVERVTLSSAPTPPPLVPRLRAAFPNAEVWIAYALTESGGARTLGRCGEGWAGSVGAPVGGTEVRIVDESRRDVPAGEAGEVWLRRPGPPPRHYWRDPEATAATWSGGWLRTGDLGFLDAAAELHLVDRKKDVISSGGLKVSPAEVEGVLLAHPAVRQAAVFGVDHEVLGQDVAAAVVAERRVDAGELQAFVRGRLAEHKVPHRIWVVDELPLTPSGKVRRRELAERLAAQAGPAPAGSASRAPAGSTEEVVAAVWGEVLGVTAVDAGADFFALGGHSLAAAQIAARLQDAFAVELPVTAVFEWPTVAELAAAVDARTAGRG